MRCRKDYRDLTADERNRFVAALHYVKSIGVVDQFAQEHEDFFHDAHHSSFFLPWHREFLRRFEDALRSFDSRVTIPYWNSIEDRATDSALWADEFLGQFNDDWNLDRDLGSSTLPSADALQETLDLGTYAEFWPDLESIIHNPPHNWVSGVMSSAASPGDPVFFLHHCWIDMIWAQWQLLNPIEPFTQSEPGRGLNDAMPPWTTTPADVVNHRTINAYSYPAGFAEMDPPLITPPTGVNFNDTPEGELVMRAAVFAVDSCQTTTFEVDPPALVSGPPGTTFTRLSPTVSVDPHINSNAYIWLTYTGTNDGDTATATVHITNTDTEEAWDIPITAETINRQTAVAVLALDQSNSMTFDSGLGVNIKRGDVLKFSAPPFVDVIYDDNALGIFSFDHDPHPGLGVTPIAGGGKLLANAAIAGYAPNPNGWTSLGEAVAFAHDLLEPVSGYDVKAMVILTDGQENHGPHTRRYIADVADLINERVYAIGLGTPENLNPGALQNLCDGHEGYLYLTGELNNDAYFRLAKYYQQILVGVQNNEIVKDPEGWLLPGQQHRIPFWLNETDLEATGVLLSPFPPAIKYTLETPDGEIIDPSVAAAHPMADYQRGNFVSYYRSGLPIPLAANMAQAGRWHAVLEVDKIYFKRYLSTLDNYPELSRQVRAHGIRYSFLVQSYSTLRMRARLSQTSREPGATMTLRANLTEYGVPVERRATVRAELIRPDNSQTVLNLREVEPGAFEASIPAPMSGIYRFNVMAAGRTMRNRPFTREQLLTGAVWAGGDNPPPRSGDDPKDDRDRICKLINCLLQKDSIRRSLEKFGVNPDEILECIRGYCAKDSPKTAQSRMAVETQLRRVFQDDRIVRVILNQMPELDGS